MIRTDSNAVFYSAHSVLEQYIKLRLIEPGKPSQNAYIESFNGRLRDAGLIEH